MKVTYSASRQDLKETEINSNLLITIQSTNEDLYITVEGDEQDVLDFIDANELDLAVNIVE